MTVLILILSTAIGAVALWFLNRVINADGLGHRSPPPSHHADLEVGSPLWWADVRSSGISWPHSQARRDLMRSPHH